MPDPTVRKVLLLRAEARACLSIMRQTFGGEERHALADEAMRLAQGARDLSRDGSRGCSTPRRPRPSPRAVPVRAVPPQDRIVPSALLAQARLAGYEQGASRNGAAIDCPHGHLMTSLRGAWLEGFGLGRSILDQCRRRADEYAGILAREGGASALADLAPSWRSP